MSTTMEQHPLIDLNPVINVTKDGTVLYSNEAGEPLLFEWGVRVGEKVPLNIVDLVQKVISRNSPEKIEIKVGNNVYLIVFQPFPDQDQECVIISGFDISDQKEFEGKLRERENKYRNIIETTVEGIWIFNAVSETTYVNEKMADMLGYSPEEMIGRFIWDFAYEEDKGIFQIKLANRKQGIDEVYELKLLRKDGSPLWISVSAKGFFDDAGEFEGSVGMFTDITEQKRAEEEVKSANIMLQLIMNNIPQGIFWKDRSSRYMGCNKVLAKAAGLGSTENIVGKTDYDLPWLIEQTEWFREYDRRVMENDTPEYHIIEPQQEVDGKLAWVKTNKTPLHDAKGNVIGILGTYEDISEHKKAEEAIRLSNLYNRSLIEASLDPLVTIGPDGKITDVNCATEEVTGYLRNDLIGTDFSDYFTEPEKAKKGYQQAFKEGSVFDYELEILNRNGSITPVLYNASVYKDEFGKVIGVFAAARDITERKKAEDALRESEEKFRQMAENIEEVFFSFTPDWKQTVYVSPAYERIWGRPLKGVYENSIAWLEGVHPDDRELPLAVVNNYIDGNNIGTDTVEFRVSRPDGTLRWILARTYPVLDKKGSVCRITGIAQDITERKKEEQRILRYNRILNGINRIFNDVIQTKTEEELGNTCLSVAIEITGSQYGFVGELGIDGRLHDIAISDMGWEKCTMYDKTGHSRPPGDLILHGLYGYVIDNGNIFFTNDPQSHPCSVGLPQGHPSLLSFLGVPLFEQGKTVGILAVANREGGYSHEQLEDLETIAPAVTQALKRKREENERKQVEKALSRERSLLENVMQTTDVMLVFLDPQFNFVWVNLAYAETCKMKPENMVGKNHFDLYPDEENEAIFRQVRDTGEGVFYKDKPFVFTDQPERGVTYWDWSLAPVKDSSGKVTGLVFSLRETTKYKQAEEALRESEKRLRRYNRILEGINWIFSNVMQANTIEELGEACLSVALKITGSEFGFINEIGADRTLYDIAKSQLGWERCLMEDKTEHRNFQSSFIIHGLYGNVIINEKSFFTNEPQSHPDSIGVPPGHPPIKSFLGVPLVQNGKTMGLIAVANRENGYSCEQLKDLEAIAPAVTQALQRKKVEEALKKAHDTLEEKVEERTIELEKAFNSLKESETSLAEAQEMAKIGNWVWDIATDKAHWSNELYHIFGRDPQKLAPTIDEFYSYIHPDDRHDYVNLANEALNEKSSLGVDVRIISDDGVERRVYLQSKIIFNETNDPVQIKGIVRDITESKKAEEKIHHLANIVESSEDAIGTLTLDGTIISWNKGAEKVYGYSVKEILGKCVSILAPPNLDKETIKLIEKIKQREQVNNYDTLGLRKDGKTINVSITLSPVFDTSGKLTAVSFISRDITKRKEAEEALTKIEIARKQEIHHRIKNNLQVISSLLDLQSEKFRGKQNIDDSQILEAFKESQDRVISMALIHEELHKGREINALNFSHYIKELTDNLFISYKLGNENTSLNTDIEEDIFFDMDTAVPLGIIINELISNSLKHAFIGRDKGEIRIRLHREECKSNTFTLSMADNGVGIPEDLDIEDLDSLGLQLVTSLVDQLDGELELKRENGTEFIIRFTVAENNNQALGQPSSN